MHLNESLGSAEPTGQEARLQPGGLRYACGHEGGADRVRGGDIRSN